MGTPLGAPETRASDLGPRLVLAAFLICSSGLAVGVAAAAQPDSGDDRRQPTSLITQIAASTTGTISGIVRSAAGEPLSARMVAAIEITSGTRHETSTTTSGGYTMKVPVGKYRLEVELRAGETLVEQPGETEINTSDLDASREEEVVQEIMLEWAHRAPSWSARPRTTRASPDPAGRGIRPENWSRRCQIISAASGGMRIPCE